MDENDHVIKFIKVRPGETVSYKHGGKGAHFLGILPTSPAREVSAYMVFAVHAGKAAPRKRKVQ